MATGSDGETLQKEDTGCCDGPKQEVCGDRQHGLQVDADPLCQHLRNVMEGHQLAALDIRR